MHFRAKPCRGFLGPRCFRCASCGRESANDSGRHVLFICLRWRLCISFLSCHPLSSPTSLKQSHKGADTKIVFFSDKHTHARTHTQREHARNITTACPRAGPETSAIRTPSIKYWSCDQGSHQPHELQCGLLVYSSLPEQLRALRRRRCMLLHLSSCAC